MATYVSLRAYMYIAAKTGGNFLWRKMMHTRLPALPLFFLEYHPIPWEIITTSYQAK